MECEDDMSEVYCGIGPCKPSLLQCCAKMTVFSSVYALAGLMTSTLSIYINSQITTLEKQFGFSSSISGIILSCSDIGYLMTTVFMSYIARRTHIPRVLGLSTISFGLSTFLCIVPYFVTKNDLYTEVNITEVKKDHDTGSNLCILRHTQDENMTLLDQCAIDKPEDESVMDTSELVRNLAITMFTLGMILQGFGKSPRYPFIGTYVDDNVEKTRTTLYLGVITGFGMFGPAIAFILGGVFSKVYVTLEETTLTPRDPRWIGAWWLGFVVFGVGALCSAVPLFFFPRRMKSGDQKFQLTERKRRRNFCTDAKELLKSILRISVNPIYICLALGNCVTFFAVSGLMTFLPKYIEVQYQIPAWKANVILGALNVLGAIGGTVTGGLITSKFKLRPITCLLFVAGIAFVSVLLHASGFFLGCPQPHVIGDPSQNDINNTSSLCSTSCDCSEDFFPVCGEDGFNYYSPCHAGCSSSSGQLYTNCTCISGNSTAVPGLCESGCDNLYPYVTIMFVAAFCTTLTMMPGFNVTIRCVSEADKPLAIGLSEFLDTLLGWLPGPVSFGKMVDTTCLSWATSCTGTGACVLYNIVFFKERYHIMLLVTRVGAVILYLLALLAAKRKERPFYVDESDQTSAEAQTFIVEHSNV